MKLLPRRGVLAWALVCAACGGAATRSSAPEAGAPDPGREFRLHYSNPGGMWLPLQLQRPLHVETLRRMGVRLDAAALSDPRGGLLGAIVWLSPGCTGSFVSPDGLILTNYHCVQEALQIHTDTKAGRNLLEDGFLARTRADELPVGVGRYAVVGYAVRDVTAKVRDGLDKIQDPVKRALAMEQHVVALCAWRSWAVSCSTLPYYGGALWLQAEGFAVQDLRLVYTPARAVGAYGGEADNWKWPRHAGDWALLRAYVRDDGASRAYAASNVPLHPRHHLRVTTAGVKAGDFVMVAGYPRGTGRTATAASIHDQVEAVLPLRIAWEKEEYAAAEQLAADPTDTGIKARLARDAIQNALAKDEATLSALTAADILAKKDALDRRIRDWAAQPGHERNAQAIRALDRLQTENARTLRADYLRGVVFRSSQLLDTARYLLRWAEQRARAKTDRQRGFHDWNLRNALDDERRFPWSYDRTLDRATFRRALILASGLPPAERTWLPVLLGVDATVIDEALIDRTLDDWYRDPQLEDERRRIAWLKTGTMAQLEAAPDPFLQAARRIGPMLKADEAKALARQGQSLLLMPWYVDAIRQVLGSLLAPDANGSLRISYGTVKAMASAPDEPVASPFTVASQLLARDTGQEPFRAPQKLLSAIASRIYGPYADPALGDELPIDFLSDLDTTGGNSGSPVLDRRGDLVGLAFDNTLDGAPDIMYDPATARTISVDVRYLIWTLDLLDGGDQLIEEMGLQPRLP
jgi:hypothetical protein